jgi:hypothetical protein
MCVIFLERKNIFMCGLIHLIKYLFVFVFQKRAVERRM